jgi:ParB family chromosome partitioning protein
VCSLFSLPSLEAEVPRANFMKKTANISDLLANGKVVDTPPAFVPMSLGSHQGGGMLFSAPPAPVTKEIVLGGAVNVMIALVDDSPYQPRDLYDSVEIDNLANSLVAAGLDEPITIRLKVGITGRYELIAGHRRIRAARSLGWSEISAYVVIRTDREAQLSAMVSNESRVDLTDFERGKLYQAAIDARFVRTQVEVADLFGTTQGFVSKRMAMLKLPVPYIIMLESSPGLFGVSCAEVIAQLTKEYPNEAVIIEQGVRRIIEEGALQTSLRQWVMGRLGAQAGSRKAKTSSYVTDRSGRPMFTAKRSTSGRDITIRIQATELDAQEVEDIVLAALRVRAEKETLILSDGADA